MKSLTIVSSTTTLRIFSMSPVLCVYRLPHTAQQENTLQRHLPDIHHNDSNVQYQETTNPESRNRNSRVD